MKLAASLPLKINGWNGCKMELALGMAAMLVSGSVSVLVDPFFTDVFYHFTG